MNIAEIITPGRDIQEILKELKQKSTVVPQWSDIEKEYDPTKHPVVADATLRPKDKTRGDFTEKVAKLTYAAEKIVTRRMNQMVFTIPVQRKYDFDEKNKELKVIADAIEAVYTNARINGVNINRGRAYFAACEVCTIWYAVDTGVEHNEYGFPTKFKFRCRSYSPMDAKKSKITQANLYPLLDEYDDMIAMSVEYTRKEDGKDAKYFETYTAEKVYNWREADGTIEELPQTEVPIGKIQCSYISRPEPIFEGVANNRNEIEFTLSRESDIVRKNSAPIVKLTGNMLNQEDKPASDIAREVYQMEPGGDVDMVSPVISPESTKFLVSQLKQHIEEDAQMPNLSMENVKNLGGVGYEARKTLLTDAHMKVGEEKHELIWFFERECSVIKALLGQANVTWQELIKEVKVRHIITPFVLDDKKAKAEELSIEVAGGFKSRKQAVKDLGDVKDVDAEIAQMELEESKSVQNNATSDIFAVTQ